MCGIRLLYCFSLGCLLLINEIRTQGFSDLWEVLSVDAEFEYGCVYYVVFLFLDDI